MARAAQAPAAIVLLRLLVLPCATPLRAPLHRSRLPLRRAGGARRRTRLPPLRAGDAPTPYPPLAEADIAALFREVPVFTLANDEGNLALLNDGTTKAVEFYVDVDVAVQRKQFWDEDDKLTVKPLSLGKALAAYGDGEDGARFVAGPRDLARARSIFVRCAGGDAPEDPRELLRAYEALDDRRSFAEPTDVPLFCVDALRRSADEPAPWYFSMSDLLETWASAGGTEAAALDRVKMVNLREMLRLLRAPTPAPKPALFLAATSSLEVVGRR